LAVVAESVILETAAGTWRPYRHWCVMPD